MKKPRSNSAKLLRGFFQAEKKDLSAISRMRYNGFICKKNEGRCRIGRKNRMYQACKQHAVTALGELLIDFTAGTTDDLGYPAMQAHPGGAPANFLAALAKHGVRTSMLGKVGGDAFGRLLIDTLRKAGIDTDGILADDTVFTTLAFVTLNADGDRNFSFARKPGADTCLQSEELRLSLIDSCDIFHFGTLSLTDEPAASATRMAVRYAKQAGKLISFDPNLRMPLWNSAEKARQAMEWGLCHADMVKLSDDEADFLWQLPPEPAACRPAVQTATR